MVEDAAITSTCPLCAEALTFKFNTDEIPYFGEIMLVSATCVCGFKYSDTIMLNEREAARYEIEFGCDDFTTRIIRSTSGTIEIPEIGVKIEPGAASEAFISNVEGILIRVEDIIKVATKWSSAEPEKFELGNRLLEKINMVKAGEESMTMILDDPFGNSAIISPKAYRRLLSEEEAQSLKTGTITIDVS
ncbi:MAG: ZPR1 zinc finger domain-containing protein [Halobacteriota archaeon]